ncbi:hypothetical protein CHISP_0481 [Chitinispirillum alkaliphilum]|nr:hypothetical protein CHISP_0481 [Chitinispirillum alkaliphilum]
MHFDFHVVEIFFSVAPGGEIPPIVPVLGVFKRLGCEM